MSSVSSHIVRRGTELTTAYFRDANKPETYVKPHGGLVVLLAITIVVFTVMLLAVEYTYDMVIATLAAVEDTNPDIYVRITSEPDPFKPTDEAEPEIGATTPLKPITSSLRTAVKHLRSRAGFWSRFRGFGMFLAYSAAYGTLASLIPVPLSSYIGQFFVHSFLSILLATWQMAWVHIVISEPSPKSWYQRIPSYKTWIKIAPVTAVTDILSAAAFFLPMSAASLTGWLDISNGKELPSAVALFRFMSICVVPAILSFLISIYARVILVRVAASMLPEEDETIVPFDRSFGGKVSPAITGGSGKIGIVDAWTTFDWAARVRYAKVTGKALAIEVALCVLAFLVIGGQFALMSKTTKPVKDDSPAM